MLQFHLKPLIYNSESAKKNEHGKIRISKKLYLHLLATDYFFGAEFRFLSLSRLTGRHYTVIVICITAEQLNTVWRGGTVKIVVSNSYEGPIYEQIKRQILHAILSLELMPGDMLPSLRSLAKDLKVGVLTINRAYTELENEGYIENIQGKGCFVANKSSDLIKKHLIDRAKKEMEHSILEARKAGITDDEIAALFHEILRRIDNG